MMGRWGEGRKDTRLGIMAGLAEEQIHRVPSSDAMPDPRWGDRNMAIVRHMCEKWGEGEGGVSGCGVVSGGVG